MGDLAYSLDGEYRNDNGFRPNQDLEELVLSAKVKFDLTSKDQIYFQASYSEFKAGDLFQYYYWPQTAALTQRVKERQEPIVFAGYHRAWNVNHHTLFLAGRLDDTFEVRDPAAGIFTLSRDAAGNPVSIVRRPFSLRFEREFEAYSAELQHIWQQPDHTVIVGARYQIGQTEPFVLLQRPPASLPPIYGTPAARQRLESDFERLSVYAYHLWQIAEPLQLTAGLTYDQLTYPLNTDLPPVREDENSKSRLSPKLGLQWSITPHTQLRALYTRSMGGLFFDNSVRLEPTQLAGFNQAYRNVTPDSVVGPVAGSTFETWGIGLDHKIGTSTYLSLQGEVLTSQAEAEVGLFEFQVPPPARPGSTVEKLDYRERSLTFTANQLLSDEWALGLRYRLTEANLKNSFPEIPSTIPVTGQNPSVTPRTEALLHDLFLYVLYNHPSGFFAQAESIFRQQHFQKGLSGLGEDSFWHFNLYGGYRFWQRRAEVRVGLLNLTDRDYRLHPLTLYSELPPERTLTVSLKLAF